MFKKFIFSSLLLIVGAAAGLIALYEFQDKLPYNPFAPTDRANTLPMVVNVPTPDASSGFDIIANAASPSVVNISTIKIERDNGLPSNDPVYDFFDDFFAPRRETLPGREERAHDLGSGLIVSSDGYILTSNHVVTGAHKISVTLVDRRMFTGELVGSDPKTDLAVIKIKAEGLSTIPWGDSDALRSGQFVLAIGNPFGLSHTVTMGIISAVGRANVGIAEFEDFIQTDAAINPGNSGGPLVNKNGELVGINTAIFTKSGGYQGIGFAVPSNMARLVMNQLIEKGRVVRGWLGVTIQELTSELSERFNHKSAGGALVSDTLRDGPAFLAGLTSGDIILTYNSNEVKDDADLKRMVSMSNPGHTVNLSVLRNGEKIKVAVVVGELKPENASHEPATPDLEDFDAFSGVSVITLTPEISSQLNLASDTLGVVVAGVQQGSPAAEAGIKRGDLIEEINRQPIRSVSEFRKYSNSMADGENVLVFINRGGRRFFITINVS